MERMTTHANAMDAIVAGVSRFQTEVFPRSRDTNVLEATSTQRFDGTQLPSVATSGSGSDSRRDHAAHMICRDKDV
jgi:hypothetical protein